MVRTLAVFLALACVQAHAEYPKRPSRAPATNTNVATAPVVETPASPVSLGIRVGGNGSFAKVASTDSSNGFGYSVAIPVYFALPPAFRLTFAPGYQSLTLTRTIDGTGQLIDPNPAQFTQTIRFLSAAATFGYNITRTGAPSAVQGSMAFWIDAGAEFLYPVSASQSDNFGGQESFTSKSKILFLSLGVAGEYRLDQHFGFGSTLQAAYNILSSSGTQLLSARFSLDVVFHL